LHYAEGKSVVNPESEPQKDKEKEKHGLRKVCWVHAPKKGRARKEENPRSKTPVGRGGGETTGDSRVSLLPQQKPRGPGEKKSP